jgi:hypothetical protein
MTMNWLTKEGPARTDPQLNIGDAARPIARHVIAMFLWLGLVGIVVVVYRVAAPPVHTLVPALLAGAGVAVLQLSLARWYYRRARMSVQDRGSYRLALVFMALAGMSAYVSLPLGVGLIAASFFGKHSGRMNDRDDG